MTFLVALMFMTPLENSRPPTYKIGQCYAAPTEFRPNVIKITDIDKKYSYRVKFAARWSEILTGEVFVIEDVYTKEVTCP